MCGICLLLEQKDTVLDTGLRVEGSRVFGAGAGGSGFHVLLQYCLDRQITCTQYLETSSRRWFKTCISNKEIK